GHFLESRIHPGTWSDGRVRCSEVRNPSFCWRVVVCLGTPHLRNRNCHAELFVLALQSLFSAAPAVGLCSILIGSARFGGHARLVHTNSTSDCARSRSRILVFGCNCVPLLCCLGRRHLHGRRIPVTHSYRAPLNRCS